MKFTEITSIKLPPGTLERLRIASEERGSKPAELIRQGIYQVLAQKAEPRGEA